jgi:hypothetical protein
MDAASSIEDATQLWCETTGNTCDDLFEADVLQLDDTHKMKCWVNTSGQPCEHGDGELQEHTAIEWARLLGRGFAFSSEQ